MDFSGDPTSIGAVLKVCLVDLILNGDNALVIALACRSLAPQHIGRVILVGTGAAIVLRVILTLFVGTLLLTPGLKLVGGLALVIIAINLTVGDDGQDAAADPGKSRRGHGDDWVGAIMVILVADLMMSLDNIVALSAIAQGNVVVLGIGLAISVPLLIFGSTLITTLLHRVPLLITAGAAMLGWIAGSFAMTDPLIVDWTNTQAPALAVAVPILAAAFVILEGRIVAREVAASRRHRLPPPVVAARGVEVRPPLAGPAPRLPVIRAAASSAPQLAATTGDPGLPDAGTAPLRAMRDE
ncbi:MAG: TerC family protein [Azospirillaceae bacterium]|nr:TerC family protein [Azospirillaceae bacterium]